MDPDVYNVRMVSKAIREFTPDLFQALAQKHLKHPGNLIFSPLSLCTVMAMLKVGARGKTDEDIKAAMKFPDDCTLNGGYSILIKSLKRNKDFSLKTLNCIFVHQGFEIRSAFPKTAERYFQGKVKQLDFSQKDKSAKRINDWVEEKTKNKIKNLISPDNLSPFTGLVLVNAIYFKGEWEKKFKKHDTFKDKFFMSRSKSIEVDMMEQEDDFLYADLPDLKVKAIVLPYEGGKLSMVIVLPEKRSAFANSEAGLKNFDLEKILKRFDRHEKTVQVFLPKFKMESTIDLVEPLTKLGMGAIFGLDADFSGIPKTQEELFVGTVIQKAVIDVNEEGTEAAVDTPIGIPRLGRAPPKPKKIYEFRADHPFIVYIIHSMKETDDTSASILFSGVFCGGD